MGEITQQYLKTLLRYEPDTGNFYWLPRENNPAFNAKHANKPAGYMHSSGYIYIKITLESGIQKSMGAHRWAFLYMEGKIPDKVDHKNRIKTDNTWNNLREVTSSQNSANSFIGNKLGIRNIEVTKNNTFKVTISKNSKVFRKTLKTLGEALWYRDKLLLALYGDFAALDALDIERVKPQNIADNFIEELLDNV